MPRLQGFTIVELLVVVTVIVILLALLAPALDRAIEMAQRVKCGSNQRAFGMANQFYAEESRHRFVPIKLQTQGAGAATYYEAWYQNTHYAELMGVRGARILPYHNPQTGLDIDLSLIPSQLADLPETPYWPAALMCPNAPDHRLRDAILWNAQGFNWSGWVGEGDWGNAIVIRRDRVERPSDKAQMTDSNDWHVVGKGWADRADYTRFWDVYGDADWATGSNAVVTYRHNEGAMVLHFDGHVAYYLKTDAWTQPVELNANLWDVKPWTPAP